MDPSNGFCLIDGGGKVNVAGMDSFIKKVKLAEAGCSYTRVSIMGPQSSGKSTLLNHVFGTKFIEMDAEKARCQTTQGIWMAKCPNIDHPTLIMDLEGSDGKERGEDDTGFEKKAALFAFAISDIVILNMWCKDLGRVQGSGKPLMRTIFEVMGKLLGYHQTTLYFVLRDKTKSPLHILEGNLQEDIKEIWDSISMPHIDKKTSINEFFDIKVIALPSYEDKEEEFSKEVNIMRQNNFNSIKLGEFSRKDRDIVPATGLSSSIQQLWEIINKSKDLDFPAIKVMMATIRCDQICKEKLARFNENEEWCQIQKDLLSHPVIGFGKKLSLVLSTCLSEYDAEAAHFDERVRTEKKGQLKDILLQRVHVAYQEMLEHIRSQTLEKFKGSFGEINSVNFSANAKKLMKQFDERCTDAIIDQGNWDTFKVRYKLQHDMDEHINVLRLLKQSELLKHYEGQLRVILPGPVKYQLASANDYTWREIRNILEHETQLTINELYSELDGLTNDKQRKNAIIAKLDGYARGLILAFAKQAAEPENVLASMIKRFERFFSHDSESNPRKWTGKENVEGIKEKACFASLKLLSILAVVRLNDNIDNIEETLYHALMDNDDNIGLNYSLNSNTWQQFPSEFTLITPIQCKEIWMELNKLTNKTVILAQEILAKIYRRDKKRLNIAANVTAAVVGVATASVITMATVGIGAPAAIGIGVSAAGATKGMVQLVGNPIVNHKNRQTQS